MSEAIVCRNVSKSFGDIAVLNRLNLAVRPGESFVLLGQSGSGKSVLLKCLLNLLSVDAGEILFDNENMVSQSTRARSEWMARIGTVFQGSALFDSLLVWENIGFTGLHSAHKAKRHEIYERVLEKLKDVDLGPETADKSPADLSGGMKRRVAFARAIFQNPDFLFLDEPTAGLDPILSKLIGKLIRKQHMALGATTFTITHDLALARAIADRVGLLSEGAIVWEGDLEALDTTDHPLVRQFTDRP